MNKVYRSRDDSWIAGCFGGLGETLDIDPNILRLAACFLGIATGFVPLLATYLIAWIIVPKESSETIA